MASPSPNTPTSDIITSDRVTRSSALAFLDRRAQEQNVQNDEDSSGNCTLDVPGTSGQSQNQTTGTIPPGLQALYTACSCLYPTQSNPLQVTTRLKYWLGGQDPLDYISMYWNEGNTELRVPPHWHYISFGLSDLHGDGRVHPLPAPGGLSGWGLEISIRVRGIKSAPPLWPSTLLQALARYVFYTGNKFCAGDHISWHSPIDGKSSRLRHLLVAVDEQLPLLETPHGKLTLLQMVGCTSRELRAAQAGAAADILDLMKNHPKGGGAWLVTDVCRNISIVPCLDDRTAMPANLAGVAAMLRWTFSGDHPMESNSVPEACSRDNDERGHLAMSTDSDRYLSTAKMSTDSFEMSSIERALPILSPAHTNSSFNRFTNSEACDNVHQLKEVHIQFNAESASLIPLAIRGRVSHGRHFTWERAGEKGDAVTLVGKGVAGVHVSPRRPYAARGRWLQIYLPPDLAEDLASQCWLPPQSDSDCSDSEEQSPDRISPPYTRRWPDHGLTISVLPDHCFNIPDTLPLDYQS